MLFLIFRMQVVQHLLQHVLGVLNQKSPSTSLQNIVRFDGRASSLLCPGPDLLRPCCWESLLFGMGGPTSSTREQFSSGGSPLRLKLRRCIRNGALLTRFSHVLYGASRSYQGIGMYVLLNGTAY